MHPACAVRRRRRLRRGILCLAGAAALGFAPLPLAAQATSPSACARPGTSACTAYRRHLAWARTADADSVWGVLRYVGTAREAEAWFEATTADEREAFLREFWERRGAEVAEAPEAVYAEHVRRLAKARRWYGVPSHYVRFDADVRNANWYRIMRSALVPASRDRHRYRTDVDDRDWC